MVEQDLDMVREWLKEDDDGRQYMEWYARPGYWWRLLGEGRKAYIVEDAVGTPIGFADVETENEEAVIAYYVRCEYRGLGYGRGVVRRILENCAREGVRQVSAYTEGANRKSTGTLRALGFTKRRELQGDMEEWSRTLDRNEMTGESELADADTGDGRLTKG